MRPTTDSRLPRNAGSSLVETLLSAVLIGVMSSALAAMASSLATSSRFALDDLESTRDIDRLRTVVSADLSEFSELDSSPSALGQLPGTNVLALSHGPTASPPGSADPGLVSYRYVAHDGSWDLVRFELAGASTPATAATARTLASGLAEPSSEWTRSDPPTHAISVTTTPSSPSAGSNSFDEHRSVELSFAAGRRFIVASTFRTAADVPGSPTPTTVPVVPVHRCGGTVTVVLNTSSSTWSQGAAQTVIGDLADFVHGLRGTPTHVRIVTFDRQALSFYPDVAVGTYVDMLAPSASITTMLSKLAALSTTSSSWRNGRNWEDGLWQAARLNTGSLLAQTPDLVVFITDGSPNRNRTNKSTDTDTTFHTADLTRAMAAADHARNTGSVLLGILLGSGADSTAIGHLTSVFGSSYWDGGTDLTPVDRARTFVRPTSEGFSRLDEILGLIGKWRCAGTVTVQQRLLASGVSIVPSDSWTISVSSSDMAEPISVTVGAGRPSATVDPGPTSGAASRAITLSQRVRTGYRHVAIECTAGGVPLPVTTTSDATGATVLGLTAPVEAIVSCTLTAEENP